MDRYIHDQNLAHYRRALSETTDPTKRQILLKLLADEQSQRAATDRDGAPALTILMLINLQIAVLALKWHGERHISMPQNRHERPDVARRKRSAFARPDI